MCVVLRGRSYLYQSWSSLFWRLYTDGLLLLFHSPRTCYSSWITTILDNFFGFFFFIIFFVCHFLCILPVFRGMPFLALFWAKLWLLMMQILWRKTFTLFYGNLTLLKVPTFRPPFFFPLVSLSFLRFPTPPSLFCLIFFFLKKH